MGVIYKLKKDVVDFVLAEKKANPALSCRRLVTLVEEKFSIAVSKSAVNEILQSASLSSPIGRASLPEKKMEPLPESSEKGSGLRSDEFDQGPQDNGILYDGMGSFFLKAAEWHLEAFPILGRLMGKYVPARQSSTQWAGGPARPVSDLAGGPPNLAADMSSLTEALLFSPLWGITELEQLKAYDRSGLWVLSGREEKIEYESMVKFWNGLTKGVDFSLTVSQELPQIFTEAFYVQLLLEDQSQILFDARYTTLWPENVQSHYSRPIKKSLFELIQYVITNVHSVVISRTPEEKFSESVYQLMGAFENLSGKRIVKAALLDENKEEIAAFTAIPGQKRSFIVGGWSNEPMMKTILSEKPQLDRFFDKYNNKFINFFKKGLLIAKNSILDKEIQSKVIFFKEEEQKGREDSWHALLTNAEEAQSPQEIITEYWTRGGLSQILSESKRGGPPVFPGTAGFADIKIPFNFYEDFLKRHQKPSLLEETPDLWLNIQILLEALHTYCQRHFLPEAYSSLDLSTITERIYRLPGYLQKEARSLRVNLKLPEGYPYRPDVEEAAAKLNPFDIKDEDGRKLVLGITP